MSAPRVAIVGAGVGGLTLAAALARVGVPCQVFEQAGHLAEIGAGVQLAPNAVRPLCRLGLAPALRRCAVAITALDVRTWTGEQVACTPMGAGCATMFGAPYLTVQRAHLQRALVELVGAQRVRLGHRLAGLRQDEDGVVLRFADGTEHRADLVIGADGIHSRVRESLVRDEPVFAGLGVFRGLVPVERLPAAAAAPLVRVWLGPGRHLVCYPVAGGTAVSFAATAPLTHPPAESWSATGDQTDLVAGFAGWAAPVAALTGAVTEVKQWALYDRAPLDRWNHGRIAVLGDAAHPMLPFLAQGATQAVEDAVDLAALLADATPADVPQRLARYARIRAPRTEAIQRGARDNVALMHLADGPRLRERDEVMRRSAGLADRAWLFGYQAGLSRVG